MSGRRKRPSALDSDFDEPEPPPPPPDDAELQLQRMTAAFHATPQPTMAQPALEPLTTVQQAHHLCASAQWTPHNQVMLVPLGRSPLSVNLLALFAYGAWKSDEQGQPIQYARPEVHPPPKVIIKTHLELGKGAHSEPVFVLSYDNPRDADAAARMVGPMLAQALDNQPFEILGGNWQSSLAYSPVTFSERTWVESSLPQKQDSKSPEVESEDDDSEEEAIARPGPSNRSHRVLHISNLPRLTSLVPFVADLHHLSGVKLAQVKLEVAQGFAKGDALAYFNSPGDCRQARKRLQEVQARREDGRLVREGGQYLNVALAGADFEWLGVTETWKAAEDALPNLPPVESPPTHEQDGSDYHLFVAHGLPVAITADEIYYAINRTHYPALESIHRVDASAGSAVSFFPADSHSVEEVERALAESRILLHGQYLRWMRKPAGCDLPQHHLPHKPPRPKPNKQRVRPRIVSAQQILAASSDQGPGPSNASSRRQVSIQERERARVARLNREKAEREGREAGSTTAYFPDEEKRKAARRKRRAESRAFGEGGESSEDWSDTASPKSYKKRKHMGLPTATEVYRRKHAEKGEPVIGWDTAQGLRPLGRDSRSPPRR